MRKITTLFIASALSLGAANLAYAENATPVEATSTDTSSQHHKGNTDAKHKGDKGSKQKHGKNSMHEKMFQGLNLTEEQKQQIETIKQESRNKMKASQQEYHRGMHNLIFNENFDKEKVQTQLAKKTERDNARMLSHLETQNKIYNILTPEQKKQFNDNFEKRLTEHQNKMAKGK